MPAQVVQAAAAGTVLADVLLDAITLARRCAFRVGGDALIVAVAVVAEAAVVRGRRTPWINQQSRIKAT